MLDIIICANSGVKNSGVWEIRGVKFWSFPLKWLVTFATGLALPRSL